MVGSELGVVKGDQFKVVEIMDYDGVKRQKEIGKISVTVVEGGNFSLCKVKDGGEDILKKFNEGRDVMCISIPDQGVKKFFKGMGM
jgi:hypothetical protein